jgi:hypothetical protein
MEEHAYYVSAFDSLKLPLRMQHHVTLKTDRSRFQVLALSKCLGEIATSVCGGVREVGCPSKNFAIFAPCRKVFITRRQRR